MKTVYPTYEIGHLWAYQQVEHARNPQSNFSFYGVSLMSYSTEIARRLEAPDGTVFVVITDCNYSSTTSKHVNEAWYSTNHLPQFLINSAHTGSRFSLDRFDPRSCRSRFDRFKLLGEVVAAYEKVIRKNVGKAATARSRREDYLNEAGDAAEKIEEIYRLYNQRIPNRVQKLIDEASPSDEDLAQLIWARRRAAEAEAKRRKAEQARRLEEQKDLIDRWKAGEKVFPRGAYSLPVFLRILPAGGVNPPQVQTSHGACVDLDAAVLLYTLLKAGKRITGAEIGSYRVVRVTDEYVKIGCHEIPLAEADRVLGPLVTPRAA